MQKLQLKPGDYVSTKSKNTLPIERLLKILDYNHVSGVFTWKARDRSYFKFIHHFVSWNKRFSGKTAGVKISKKNKIYIKLNIDGVNLYAHRIAWAIFYGEWPELELDHINGNSEDNSISNLRHVSRLENCRNVSTQKNSFSGYCGVNWHSIAKKWRARVKICGVEYYIGLFDDPEIAAKAIKEKRDSMGFHNNHGLQIIHNVGALV